MESFLRPVPYQGGTQENGCRVNRDRECDVRPTFLMEALPQTRAGRRAGVALGAVIASEYDVSADWLIVLRAQGLAGGVPTALTVGGLPGNPRGSPPAGGGGTAGPKPQY